MHRAPIDRRRFPDDAIVDHWPARDGWPLRRLRLGAADGQAPRGTIVMQGGRGDMLEKYIETCVDLSRMGWAVEAFDWRGQGGSGRLSADRHVGHVTSFSPWIDDLAHYVADMAARTSGPIVLAGHSMGGHLVLRTLVAGAVRADAAVLVAPMLGYAGGVPPSIGWRAARLMQSLGDPARAAWKTSEKPGSSLKLRQQLLTHDDARYADEMWWLQASPDIALGPPSWTWVAEGYASNRRLAAPGVLEAVTTPVLILSAQEDRLVSHKAAEQAARRLPNATFHAYGPGVAHEILRETDAVRRDALDRIDGFLDRVLATR